ncbi:MAG: ASCH domain-containing protein [Oscillospiraceae bacterium]
MSKAVLISIQPQWCELILRGKKTIEVRKSRPKLKPPFKCYIYQSKGRDRLIEVMKDGDLNYGEIYHGKPVFIKTMGYRSGYKGLFDREQKIVGEFVCDCIISHCEMANADIAEQQGCIKREEFFEYSNGKELFGWHISDLIIYDKPKELSEFYAPCNKDCTNCDMWQYIRVNADEYDMECSSEIYGHKPLEKTPQSWCYVEECKE